METARVSRLAPVDKALVLILVPLWAACFVLAVRAQFEVRGMAAVEFSAAGLYIRPTLGRRAKTQLERPIH
jgi:hypothetical protein